MIYRYVSAAHGLSCVGNHGETAQSEATTCVTAAALCS
jgi:hypothetical protein